MATLSYAAVTLSLLSDIVGRELFGQGIWGAERFAVYAAIIAAFLGLSLASADDLLIRPRFLDAIVPQRFNVAVNRASDAVSALIYMSLGGLAIGYVMGSYARGDITPVLDWPLWPLQLVLPYSFLSAGGRHLLYSVQPDLKQAKIYNEIPE